MRLRALPKVSMENTKHLPIHRRKDAARAGVII